MFPSTHIRTLSNLSVFSFIWANRIFYSTFIQIAVLLLIAFSPVPACSQDRIVNANFRAPYGAEVNTWNGNLFYDRLDLNVAAVGDNINIRFSYNTKKAGDDHGYGKGWTMNYNMFYSVDSSENVTINMPDGRKNLYNWTGVTYASPDGNFETLKEHLPDQYRLTKRNGKAYYFEDSSHKKLTRIKDPNGNTLDFQYNGSGELESIQSSCGTEIALSWTSSHLASITDSTETPHRTYSYAYNGSNQLIQYTDPASNMELYTYDANDRMDTLTNKNGNSLAVSYHPSGAVQSLKTAITDQSFAYDLGMKKTTVTEVVGAGMQTTSYTYDTNGRLTEFAGNCCGFNIQYAYDANNNLTQITDANGNSTTYTYNGLGQMLTETDALGHTATYSYTLIGNEIAGMSDKNGNQSTYNFDIKGNLVQVVMPHGVVETYTYHGDGTRASFTDANGNTTAYAHDNCGNPSTDTLPLGYVRQYQFNNRVELLSRTNTNGCTTTYTYDALGRMISETDALSSVSTNSYDPEGNLISKTDKNGNLTTLGYDALNRLTTENEPHGVAHTLTYDEKRPTSYTDPNGNTTNYTYDNLNRLTQLTDAHGNNTDFTYDPKGNMLTRTNKLGNTTQLQYDLVDRITLMTDALGGTDTFNYDPYGNRTSHINELGNTMMMDYDSLNRLVKLTDPIGGMTLFAFDGVGNLLQQTDANGNSTSSSYDALNRLDTLTDALGGHISYTYDGEGNLLSTTDQNDNTTTFTYDCLNRTDTTANALNEMTTFAYDANSNQTQRKLPNGNMLVFVFDSLNRVTQLNDSFGSISLYDYDQNSNTTSLTDGNGNATTYTYDGLDRRISVMDALGEKMSYGYDANSNVISDTMRNGNVTNYEYDALDRLTKTTDQLSGMVLSSYDAADNLTQITDENGHATQYGYDALNRLVTETFADTTTRLYNYDAVGNRTVRVDNNEDTTAYTYDALNRLIERDYPGPNDDDFTYDAANRLITANNANANITYSYDNADRLLSETLNGHTTTYAYDIPNRKRTVTYPNGRQLERIMDVRNRLDSIREAGSTLVTFDYDLGNRMTQKNYLNGTVTDYTYNANNWITQLTHNNGVNFIDFEYEHEQEGNILNVTHNHKTDFSEEYVYDGLERLTTYKKGTLVGSNIPAPATQSVYDLDAVGNRNNVNKDGNNTVYTPNNMNEYSQIADPAVTNPVHDANGNLKDDGNRQYDYDYENRLLRAGEDAIYAYDAFGRRVRKVADGYVTNYFYDGRQVIMEILQNPNCPLFIHLAGIDSSLINTYTAQHFIQSTMSIIDTSQVTYMATDSILLDKGFFVEKESSLEVLNNGCLVSNDTPDTTTYVYGTWIDDVLSMHRSGSNYYYHHNSLGSVSAITDDGGTVLERYEYDAYGQPMFFDGAYTAQPGSSVGNPYLYTSRRYDQETGLYYYRARYYDPTHGRFLQRDPLDYVDGMNLYEYVKSNVINNSDPLGLGTFGFEVSLGSFSGVIGIEVSIGIHIGHSPRTGWSWSVPVTVEPQVGLGESTGVSFTQVSTTAEQTSDLEDNTVSFGGEGEVGIGVSGAFLWSPENWWGYKLGPGLGFGGNGHVGFPVTMAIWGSPPTPPPPPPPPPTPIHPHLWLPPTPEPSLPQIPEEHRKRKILYEENRHSSYCELHPEFGCTSNCSGPYDEVDEGTRQQVIEEARKN